MSAYQFSAAAVPAVSTAAAVALFGIVLASVRSSRTSASILLMALAGSVWQASSALMFLTADPQRALVWARIGCAAIAFLPPAAYQFVASFLPTAHPQRRRIVIVVSWLVAAQFAILTLTTAYFVTGVQRYWWGFYPVLHIAAKILFPLLGGVLLAAAVADIGRAYPASKGTERERIRLFSVALALLVAAGVDALPLYGVPVYPFGWAPLLASMAVILYTVTKLGMVPLTPSLAANEIIGTMRDLLLVSDRDGRIRFANNAACSFLGYAREEIIGRPLSEVLVPSTGEGTTPLQGWVRDREYIFRTRMGQPIELTLSHSPLTHRGEVTGAVIIGRDLRERKRYEWEARRAVTLLQSTLDSTADGILAIGQQGRVLTWNQRFADLWRIPPELMEHEDDRDLISHLSDQLSDPTAFRNSLAAAGEDPEEESARMLVFKDGRRFEQYSLRRFLDNAPLRVWSFRDVTARLAAEEALRDSEARYRLLFEQNAAGVCLATSSGQIIDCNPTFAAMVGSSAEELRNRDLRQVFESGDKVDDFRRRLDQTQTLSGVEIELRGRDGARVSALANVSLFGSGERALLHMTAVDITDRKRAEEQIEFQAYHDALTQLANRRLFVERLELSLLAARRNRGNVGVLFLDLDRFKAINDTLGHSVADQLLQEVANRLRACVRQTDTVARYGGDEFTVILPDLNQPEDAAQVAEKILEKVVEPVVVGPNSIQVSVSIGIAVYPHDGTDTDTLLRNADDAMYRAKQSGRNTYQLSTEQMKTRAMERLSMHDRLRKAMAENELVLVYLPEVNIASGEVTGAEALVRWHDPQRGILEARDFLPLAEETRLVVPLGEWALSSACRQVREWSGTGLPVRVAVNISARHFQQRDLAATVRNAIESAGIQARQVQIEISEAIAMRDVDLTVELLNRLRETGVSIAIDSFGSAYSAFGSLRALPIDAVKLDRRFIEHAGQPGPDAAIVDAVIAVSRSLGLRVCADGVERREQYHFLAAHGCEDGQGSYFSPPLDGESFGSYARSRRPIAGPK